MSSERRRRGLRRSTTTRTTTARPGSPASFRERAAGGMMGIAGGEAWQGARRGFEAGGPVTGAMFDLCNSYLGDSHRTPVRTAERQAGVPAPGWLLPVAVTRSQRDLISDTLELAIASGVTRASLRSCVTYVELARALADGKPAGQAIPQVTGRPAPNASAGPPRLCGMAPIDALTTGIWALTQEGQLGDVAPTLTQHTEPWVAAAAAGLLGLRDGCAAVPAQWFRRVPATGACLELAPALLQAGGAQEPSGSAAAA